MNKKFTKLIAAVALLVFMTPAMVGWGQTRAEGDTHEFSQSLQQLLNDNASIASINIAQQSYPIKKVSIHYRYNKTISNAVTMEVIVNGTSWGTQYSTGTGSNYTTIDFEGSSTIGAVEINFTNNTGSGTGHGTFYVDLVTLTEGSSGGGSNPSCSIAPTTWDFGTVMTNSTQSKEFTVTTANLTGNLVVAIDNADKGFSVSPSSILQSATSTTVTVTYNPTTANAETTATLTISGGGLASNATASITGTAADGKTITFNAGSGSCATSSYTALSGTNYDLPVAEPSAGCAAAGWVFAGWATATVDETTTAPTPLYTGSYTISNNVTLYAVYSVTDSSGSGTTTFNFEEIASANSWENGKAYTPVVIGEVTLAGNGGGNNAKYYTSDNSWRMYNGGTVNISITTNNISSVTSTPSKTFTINEGAASLSCTETIKFTQIVVAYGSSTTTYNSTPSCTEAVATPTFDPAPGTINTTTNVTISCATIGATVYYTTNGDTPTTESAVYSTAIPVSATTTIKAMAAKEGMTNSIVAVGEYVFVVENTYNLVTTVTPGKHYIIVGKNGDNYYAMDEQKSSNRDQKDITDKVTNEGAKVAAMSNFGLFEFVISGPDTDGHYTIYDEVNNGYLCAGTGNSNQLKTQSFNASNGIWTISFESGNKANIVAEGVDRGTMQYNSSSNIFACYGSASQSDIYLYEKVETNYTFYHDVAKYTATESDKWQLIASPVAGAPVTVATTGTYDLYAYYEPTHIWLNQKVVDNGITAFEAGKGYLYANAANKTLAFEGAANTFTGFALSFAGSGVTKGLNLVGNPRPNQNDMWIYDGYSVVGDINYLKLNADGSGFVSGTTDGSGIIPLVPMEGIFVQATGTCQTWKDAASSSAKGSGETTIESSRNLLTLNLNGDSGSIVDNIIVRFGSGRNLAKMVLNEQGTKLYIPQDGADYAIVRSEAQGEMPVNFKAAQNGSYTLSIDIEADMDYLHLIDNMTGADVDLLANPSYTFDARTSDYASRFRLVFSANTVDDNNSNGSATFAYFNGSEWVVNSNGNATLQVVDVMGRVLSSETVNGNHNMNLNLSTGVYMLRLVNGNDVKTQKIVVR